jgi:hypothetical protein
LLALASLWLLTPFVSGALLGSSPRARQLAGRHYVPFVSVGWTGIALVLLGAFVLPRPESLLAIGLGGPLSGLSFWSRREGGDDGGGGEGDDDHDPEPPPPGGDWERIVRDLERQVDRHGGPRLPAATPGRRRRERKPSPSPSRV